MHACLRVPDILHCIIGFSKDDRNSDHPDTSYKDVARLARTCKAFKDPALDALWRKQSSLSPLVMCLPNRFWTRGNRSQNPVLRWLRWGSSRRDADRDKVKVVSLTMKPPPSLQDWLSLKRYSRRIQAFDSTPLDLPGICSNALHVFQPGLFPELFPSLRTLNFDVFNREPSYVRPIWLLTPMRLPHLVHLAFTICEHHQYQDPNEILQLPLACAPSLQTLRIDAVFDVNRRITPVHLAASFRETPYLRILSLSRNLDVSSNLREMIYLQNLQELTVTLPDDFDIDVHPSMQPILPSLRYLDVTVGSLNQGTNFLSFISSELGHVKISHRLPAIWSDIYQLFQAIYRIYRRFPDFHTLIVEYSDTIALSTDPSFDLPRWILKPLLACRRLRVFDLTSRGMLGINDAFIAQIALAWPDLETFHLRGSQRKLSRVTLRGLRELLRSCPRLLSLGMEVDTRVLPEEEPEMETLSLQSLHITTIGREGVHIRVAQYLRVLAPRLQVLCIESVRPDLGWAWAGNVLCDQPSPRPTQPMVAFHLLLLSKESYRPLLPLPDGPRCAGCLWMEPCFSSLPW
ncbi:hypothetical protein F5J12DRAFT_114598 [Pisolithus orientalis]|uniref:uncharacterized protein n=1 Tax=Pisolithus orientalis TaxID=936130 RepID=UPI002223FBB2|nr:uncharacterized protein F5J12DRAFT_114598 [Pisolithus orientalis]KAI6006301.1 hypothetical protein F5J12DRAFT_114598 [Pisolithus orientalis]